MLVGDLSDGIDIRNIAVRIAKSLKVDGSCVVLDGSLNRCKVMSIYKSCVDAILWKCV